MLTDYYGDIAHLLFLLFNKLYLNQNGSMKKLRNLPSFVSIPFSFTYVLFSNTLFILFKYTEEFFRGFPFKQILFHLILQL